MSVKELKQIFPKWYTKWLFDSLGIEEGDETSERLLDPLFKLNKNWLQENYQQQEYAWNETDVATAYALYYMSINIPKLWMVLNNSHLWRSQEIHNVNSIVEFGCGPGTFLWSYLFYLYSEEPQQLAKLQKIRGVDISPENLKVARKLFDKLKSKKAFAHIEAEFICGQWEDEVQNGDEDLVIFGNSLIESTVDLTSLEDTFDNILVIEPGTQKHFQRLKALRDSMLTKDWHIHFPCSGSSKCPMSDDNWCHFHVNRFILPFVQKMSNAAKRRNHRHNFSAFLFSRKSSALSRQNWRMLSTVRKVKRSAIRYICNGEQMFEAVLPRKARNEDNKDFISMDAGELAYSLSKFKNKRMNEYDKFSNIKRTQFDTK